MFIVYFMFFAVILLAIIGLASVIRKIFYRFYSIVPENYTYYHFIFINKNTVDAAIELKFTLKRYMWYPISFYPIIILDDSLDSLIADQCKQICDKYGFSYFFKSDCLDLFKEDVDCLIRPMLKKKQ